jgi:hypothetical protein
MEDGVMGDWQSAGEPHSPTPWEISPCRTVDDTAMIVGGENFQFGLIADVTEDKDAAFIVKAVNSYDDHIAALKGAEVVANTAGSLLKEKDERIGALVKALEFIRDGYANQDVNHVDYRVKVYQVALEALAKAGGTT